MPQEETEILLRDRYELSEELELESFVVMEAEAIADMSLLNETPDDLALEGESK